jgi:antitoxin VapB
VRQTTKVFMMGRRQAVLLPREFGFAPSEVFIRRDPLTGDVVLSRKPADWQGFLDTVAQTPDVDDFLSERKQTHTQRNPFEG